MHPPIAQFAATIAAANRMAIEPRVLGIASAAVDLARESKNSKL